MWHNHKDDVLPDIVSRKDAISQGLRHYFTGIPCKKGHVSLRLTGDCSCMRCSRERAVNSYYADVEKFRARAKAEYWKDPAKMLAREKARRAADPEKTRARDRERRKTSPETLSQSRERVRIWKLLNPEKRRVSLRNHQARRRKAPGKHGVADIRFLMEKQSGKCAHSWCRRPLKPRYHVDHVIPIKLGGHNDRKNLQLLCIPCNTSKKATHPVEFAQQHGLLL